MLTIQASEHFKYGMFATDIYNDDIALTINGLCTVANCAHKVMIACHVITIIT